MQAEFREPTPEGIAKRIINSGETPESFVGMLNAIAQGMESGRFRSDLSCWEHKVRFFEMAQRMYVSNELPDFNDCEIGAHEGQCKSPLCRRMTQAYFEVLAPSTDEDSIKIADFLTELEGELMFGKERDDLKGKPSGFYDSNTDESLLIAKAVEITDKCQLRDGNEGLLIYTLPVKGALVKIEEKGIGGMHVAFPLKSQMFSYKDPVFESVAAGMGIDPQFLQEIILANAPKVS